MPFITRNSAQPIIIYVVDDSSNRYRLNVHRTGEVNPIAIPNEWIESLTHGLHWAITTIPLHGPTSGMGVIHQLSPVKATTYDFR
jgi:hypothetical protein